MPYVADVNNNKVDVNNNEVEVKPEVKTENTDTAEELNLEQAKIERAAAMARQAEIAQELERLKELVHVSS